MNESLVQLLVGITGARRLVRNLERLSLKVPIYELAGRRDRLSLLLFHLRILGRP